MQFTPGNGDIYTGMSGGYGPVSPEINYVKGEHEETTPEMSPGQIERDNGMLCCIFLSCLVLYHYPMSWCIITSPQLFQQC